MTDTVEFTLPALRELSDEEITRRYEQINRLIDIAVKKLQWARGTRRDTLRRMHGTLLGKQAVLGEIMDERGLS